MKMVAALMCLQHVFCLFPQSHSLTKLLAISLSSVCITAVSAQDDKVTCEVQPVVPLADTTLTCHFPEDLSETKKDFTVYHYTNSGKPEPVVDCRWKEGTLDCCVSPGVEYNKMVKRDLTVTLQRMTSELVGMYACQVAGYGIFSLKTCEFKFKLDDKVTCEVEPVAPFANTTLTCHFPEDLSQTKKDFTVYRYTKDSNSEAVVDCWWLEGKLDCYVSRGVEHKMVKRDLTVTLQRMTSELTGMYACQVAGYGTSMLETCEFNFKLGKDNSCNIEYKTSDFQAKLTCLFSEDIGKRKTNFSVYKHSGQVQQAVIDCSWIDERLSCRVENGYQYDDKVSAYLTLGILEVTKEKEGDYSCWHSGSENTQLKSCFLYASKEIVQSGNQNTLDLGILLLLEILLAAGIDLLT